MASFRSPGLNIFPEEVFQCCIIVLEVDVKYSILISVFFFELQSLSSQVIAV